MLEVIKYTGFTGEVVPGEDRSGNRSLGYMRAKFRSKKNACSYYDRHNPHMRSLNFHNNWMSDSDPETRLKYIVRNDYGLDDNIPPFDLKDEPELQGTQGKTYNYLK